MKKLTILSILAVIVLSACGSMNQTNTPELKFAPKLTMYEEGIVHFEVGVLNQSSQKFSGKKDINIQVIVTDDDGKIRNQMQILDLGAIAANDEIVPFTSDAEYEAGQYIASLTGEGIPSLSVPFEIREDAGVRSLAAPPDFIDPGTEFTIIDPDL